jgi:hypothetical protein
MMHSYSFRLQSCKANYLSSDILLPIMLVALTIIFALHPKPSDSFRITYSIELKAESCHPFEPNVYTAIHPDLVVADTAAEETLGEESLIPCQGLEEENLECALLFHPCQIECPRSL